MGGASENRDAQGRAWPRAIVFDLDGTLIDSAPDLAAALNLVLEMRGARPLPVDQVRLMIGRGIPNLIREGFAAARLPLSDEDMAELLPAYLLYYNAHASDLTTLRPDAYALLEHLAAQGVRMGVCTNKPTDVSRQILTDFHIAHYFDAVIGGDSGLPKKPDPAPLFACLDKLETDLTQALYVGDSETDVTLARRAGLPVVAVAGGYTAKTVDQLGADETIGRLGELPHVFSRLTPTAADNTAKGSSEA